MAADSYKAARVTNPVRLRDCITRFTVQYVSLCVPCLLPSQCQKDKQRLPATPTVAGARVQ
jgi:hypothetical protein